MYQAIVFLPLVGAILAGLIALAGARARYPGGSPEAVGQIMPIRMALRTTTPRMSTRRTITAHTTRTIRPSRPPPARARPS